MIRHVVPVVPWSIARTHFIREGIWRAIDAFVGDYAGGESGGRDVECGMAHDRVHRRDGAAAREPHLVRAALFDRDRVAVRGGAVDGGPGRADVERDAVMLRGDRDGVRADLV